MLAARSMLAGSEGEGPGPLIPCRPRRDSVVGGGRLVGLPGIREPGPVIGRREVGYPGSEARRVVRYKL